VGLLFLVILFLILSGVILNFQDSPLRVSFFDVGQGDSILISRGSHQILIDGGPNGEAVLEKLGRMLPFWDREIEVVIATHPDADHLSGLVDVLERYKVDLVIDSGMESDTQVFRRFEKIISEKGIRKGRASLGQSLKIGEGVLSIMSPPPEFPGGKVKDTNKESIVLKFDFGENSFLLMADAPIEKEYELLKKYPNLHSRILKAGHHGSKYSSSKEFLKKVSPKEIILSVGKNNRYGHPSPEALERFRETGATIFRADEVGDMIYVCANEKESCQGESF
jgi:competence protein ComEC